MYCLLPSFDLSTLEESSSSLSTSEEEESSSLSISLMVEDVSCDNQMKNFFVDSIN